MTTHTRSIIKQRVNLCPNCGSSDIHLHTCKDGRTSYEVYCNACGEHTWWASSQAIAISRWQSGELRGYFVSVPDDLFGVVK